MSDLSWKTKKKGYWIFKDGKVIKDIENQKRIYFIVKGDQKNHSVIFDKTKGTYTCDCEFFSLKLKHCSHIYAVKLFIDDKNGKN